MDGEGAEFWMRIGERIKATEMRLDKIEDMISGAKAILTRLGLVLLLMAGGIIAKMPAEKTGEYTAEFLKGLRSR